MSPLINSYYGPPVLHNIFPTSQKIGNINGNYWMQDIVSMHYLDRLASTDQQGDFIRSVWQKLYERVLHEVAGMMLGREEYFVIRFVPKWFTDYEKNEYRFSVIAEIMQALEKSVVMPKFIYDNQCRLIEWRCGYCNSPNEVKSRHCTQCGAPRALLIQEM